MNELVQDFLVDLRRTADSCNFRLLLHHMLRARLVGLRRQSLLARWVLTLDLALDMAVALETVTKDATEMVTSEGKLLEITAMGSHSPHL